MSVSVSLETGICFGPSAMRLQPASTNGTTGFAWTFGTKSGMLTAAHCIPSGGSISYPNYANAGTVASGSEENWNVNTGTAYYTGQTVYRGDVALIRYSTAASSAVIYSGAPHSNTTSVVKSVQTRRAQVGDAACTNGVITGGWCGMVTAVNVNAWYFDDGPNVWARRIQQTEALGPSCPQDGDSGGPVFRDVTGGKAAVGILSGSGAFGVSCAMYFTDVLDADAGLPGTIKLSP
jgi:hypothetical protein